MRMYWYDPRWIWDFLGRSMTLLCVRSLSTVLPRSNGGIRLLALHTLSGDIYSDWNTLVTNTKLGQIFREIRDEHSMEISNSWHIAVSMPRTFRSCTSITEICQWKKRGEKKEKVEKTKEKRVKKDKKDRKWWRKIRQKEIIIIFFVAVTSVNIVAVTTTDQIFGFLDENRLIFVVLRCRYQRLERDFGIQLWLRQNSWFYGILPPPRSP